MSLGLLLFSLFLVKTMVVFCDFIREETYTYTERERERGKRRIENNREYKYITSLTPLSLPPQQIIEELLTLQQILTCLLILILHFQRAKQLLHSCLSLSCTSLLAHLLSTLSRGGRANRGTPATCGGPPPASAPPPTCATCAPRSIRRRIKPSSSSIVFSSLCKSFHEIGTRRRMG